jgi:hypothetical protein
MAAPRNPLPSGGGEIAVLWITAGLSCDGDTIAMTAATQPSIEDLVRGAIPWAEPPARLPVRGVRPRAAIF